MNTRTQSTTDKPADRSEPSPDAKVRPTDSGPANQSERERERRTGEAEKGPGSASADVGMTADGGPVENT